MFPKIFNVKNMLAFLNTYRKKNEIFIVSVLVENSPNRYAFLQVRLAGGLTLVHCVAGVSRSATLCLAYLVKHRGMSLREAYVHLKKARPCVRPNCGFFNQLIDFERKTRGNASVSMVTVLGVLVPDVYQDDYQNMLCTRNCTTATAVGPH